MLAIVSAVLEAIASFFGKLVRNDYDQQQWA
jgi:hypothetical protein